MPRRLARLLAAALLILAGSYDSRFVQRVAAADCSASYCAWLEIVPGNGAGSGFVSTNPYGIECEWSGARSGTCLYQFSWSHADSDGIDVDLFLDPGAHSYVCYGLTCAGLEARLVRTVHLNPGDDIDVFPVFNLGSVTTVEMRMSGNGSGRVTSSPAGLDCRLTLGVKSGTCKRDFWYIGSSSTVTLTSTADAGSYPCNGSAGVCLPPGSTITSTVTINPGGSLPQAAYFVAVPVTVTITGHGSVTSEPAGINCPSTCSKWFKPSSDWIVLTATPASGYFVKSWSGPCDPNTGIQTQCRFQVGYTGPSIAVVFASTSTPPPPPTSTPRPTVTPKPTATARTTPRPTASSPTSSANNAPATPAASPLPVVTGGPDPVPSDAGPSPDALASSDPGPSAGGDGSAPPATPVPAASGAPPVPSGSNATAGGIDPLVLFLLAIVAVLTLVVGYLLGTRRRGEGAATQPRA